MGFEVPTKRDPHEYPDRIPRARIELIPEKNPERNWRNEEDEKFVPALILCWESGGTHGEGDWLAGEGRSVSYVKDSPEPMWTDLDTILEHFCPEITYLRYRKLERLVRFFTKTDNGYYGDSTTFSIKALWLKDLWKFLKDQKLFKETEPK